MKTRKEIELIMKRESVHIAQETAYTCDDHEVRKAAKELSSTAESKDGVCEGVYNSTLFCVVTSPSLYK